MATLPKSTLEQRGVLRTVVEEGSFAAAAEALHRSQSSVSYAVARLQAAVGIDLLEMQGRRAVLTKAGAALLAEIAPLIDDLNRIESRGRQLAQGHAVRIRLLVDNLFPKPRLFAALRKTVDAYPQAEVQLVETIRQSLAGVSEDCYDLAVLVAEPGSNGPDIVADIQLIATTHASHPLVAGPQPPSRSALARFPRVEIREIGPSGVEFDTNGRLWHVNTVATAIDAVRHGLCYGWLPAHHIQAELREGSLRPLLLANDLMRNIPLALYLRDGLSRDPATMELARLLERTPEHESPDK